MLNVKYVNVKYLNVKYLIVKYLNVRYLNVKYFESCTLTNHGWCLTHLVLEMLTHLKTDRADTRETQAGLPG